MSNYENIPLSEDTKKGMSLNNNDQHFLKRLFDRQDEVLDEKLKDIYVILNNQNKIIIKIQRILDTIQEEICDHESRIKKLEEKVDNIIDLMDKKT